MHLSTYKTLSMAVLALGAIPTVHGVPVRFNIQSRPPRDDSNINMDPQFNWRTDGPGPIHVQRGHQNALRFSEVPTTLPDVYKKSGAMGHNGLEEMEVKLTGKTSISDIWGEGLLDNVGLETADIELLEHAMRKRTETNAITVDSVNQTKLDAPYNNIHLMNQDLNVSFSNSLQGGLGMHEEQGARLQRP